MEVRADWCKLGAQAGFNPPSFYACRFWVLGESKVGKTTLMSGIPNSLLIDLEDGGHSIPDAKGARIRVPVYCDADVTPDLQRSAEQSGRPFMSLLSLMTKLTEDARAGNPAFSHLIFDSADRLQEMVLAQLSKERGMDIRSAKAGRDRWSVIAEKCLGFTRQATSLGYAWSILSHLKEEVKEIGETVVRIQRPGITPLYQAGLKQDTEYLIGIRKVQVRDPKTGNSTWRYEVETQSSPSSTQTLTLGGRVSLPDRIKNIPLIGGIAAVKAAYDEEVSRLRTLVQANHSPATTTP